MTPILQKAIAELNKEQPRLDYVRGMLETLLETLPKPAPINHHPPQLINIPGKGVINAAELNANKPMAR